MHSVEGFAANHQEHATCRNLSGWHPCSQTQCIEFWHMIQGQKDLTRTAEGQHRTQEVCRTLHVMSAHRVCNVYLTPFPYNKKKKPAQHTVIQELLFFLQAWTNLAGDLLSIHLEGQTCTWTQSMLIGRVATCPHANSAADRTRSLILGKEEKLIIGF